MKPIFNLILKSVGLALAIAVFVLASINVEIDNQVMFLLLGGGLTCFGLSLFDEKEKNTNDDNSK